jgi:arsenate reductase
MAEGFLRSFDNTLTVYSAGITAAERVHPKAVQVMKEINIDISSGYPKNADRFLNDSFDYVITVCDNAKETCPAFTGGVKHRIHIGFDDPAQAEGDEEEIISVFRRVRDEIKMEFQKFFLTINKQTRSA